MNAVRLNGGQNWSPDDLRRIVRVERMELTAELSKLRRRVGEIEKRLGELDKADAILEGE